MKILVGPQAGQQIEFIRYIELGMAIYMIVTGIMFLFFPSIFSYPVYEPWRHSGLHIWGTLCVSIGAGHVLALWWNGRNRVASRIVRVISCAAHITVMLYFGMMFLSVGAYWGCVLFLFFMPWMMLPVVSRIIAELKFFQGER